MIIIIIVVTITIVIIVIIVIILLLLLSIVTIIYCYSKLSTSASVMCVGLAGRASSRLRIEITLPVASESKLRGLHLRLSNGSASASHHSQPLSKGSCLLALLALAMRSECLILGLRGIRLSFGPLTLHAEGLLATLLGLVFSWFPRGVLSCAITINLMNGTWSTALIAGSFSGSTGYGARQTCSAVQRSTSRLSQPALTHTRPYSGRHFPNAPSKPSPLHGLSDLHVDSGAALNLLQQQTGRDMWAMLGPPLSS